MRNPTLEEKIVIFKTIVISQKCGKNCFPIIYNNCPKTYYKSTWKNTVGFSVEKLLCNN